MLQRGRLHRFNPALSFSPQGFRGETWLPETQRDQRLPTEIKVTEECPYGFSLAA